ncbi:conserved hypothetical protein [Candidatus Sulfopaludibacter sp. SbA3]|nr:conserved hypothetical protein [Candidatus Sulfopaludibacter sp. SbA3]
MVNSYPHQRNCSQPDRTVHRALCRDSIAASLLLISTALTACGLGCASSHRIAPVLLFAGTGASPNDVAAIETILDNSHLDYSTVNSFQLNGMTEPRISGYRLLIVPGGNFVKMGNSLTASTAANVRNAVNSGMNYLGICAGGFLAGRFPASYNSFNLSSGVQFGFYFPETNGNVPGHVSELYGFRPEVGPQYETHKATVRITTPEGPALDQYWESGPQFAGWGEVVGKYPDGTPAIVEGSVGKGWIILSGVHPEAPESWRRGMVFNTAVSDDTAYARMLIFAAFNRTNLAHYLRPIRFGL